MKQINIRSSLLASERTLLGICMAALTTALASNTVAVAPVQFGSATSFAVGKSPTAIAAADFNRDGKLDIATANTGSNSISVLFGDGTGAFAGRTDYVAVANSPRGLVVAEFSSDSNLDMVVLGPNNGRTLLGNGSGGFAVTAITNNLIGVSTGDFNGDGKQDLAGPGVAVAFGRGDGSFGLAANYPAPSYDLAVGDCNGDGKPDLVTSDYSESSISVLMNKGDGTFNARTSYPGPFSEYHYSLALADFNRDGKLDVAVLNHYARSVTVRLNIGNGAFGSPNDYSVGSCSPLSVAAGDFNCDWKVDLVVRSFECLKFLLGNGDGSFSSGLAITARPTGGLAVGDLNGDGKPDIAFTTYPNSVSVLLNQTPPVLEITGKIGHVQVSWNAILGDDQMLETNTNLTDTAGWREFPSPPVVIGNQKAVADWTTEGKKFYPLRKP